MDGDLNLLPSRAKFQAKRTAIQKKIQFFLWVFGGVWVLSLVIVLGLFFISQMILGSFEDTYNKGLSSYKTLLGEMVINQQVKYQAKVVSKVLDKRFEYGYSIESVRSLFAEGIEVNDIDIERNESFTLSGSFKDGKLMDGIEEKVVMINQGAVEGFKKAELSSVEVNDDGWSFGMEVFQE